MRRTEYVLSPSLPGISRRNGCGCGDVLRDSLARKQTNKQPGATANKQAKQPPRVGACAVRTHLARAGRARHAARAQGPRVARRGTVAAAKPKPGAGGAGRRSGPTERADGAGRRREHLDESPKVLRNGSPTHSTHTVPAQYPHSTRTVPAQYPHSTAPTISSGAHPPFFRGTPRVREIACARRTATCMPCAAPGSGLWQRGPFVQLGIRREPVRPQLALRLGRRHSRSVAARSAS
jgi:hypothetical protein